MEFANYTHQPTKKEAEPLLMWTAPIAKHLPWPGHGYSIHFGRSHQVYGIGAGHMHLSVWVSRYEINGHRPIYPYFRLQQREWGSFIVKDLLDILGKLWPPPGKTNVSKQRVQKAVKLIALSYARHPRKKAPALKQGTALSSKRLIHYAEVGQPQVAARVKWGIIVPDPSYKDIAKMLRGVL